MAWKSARGGNLETFQIFLGMCLAVVRFVAFCIPWNVQEFSKPLFPKTSPPLAFPSRLFILYIVCPDCWPLPSMAAVKTFAFKYISQILPHLPCPHHKQNQHKHIPYHFSHGKVRWNKGKPPDRSEQKITILWEKVYIIPSGACNPYQECWLLSFKALTELRTREWYLGKLKWHKALLPKFSWLFLH